MAYILVADDDPLYRDLVETMLRRQGHMVASVESGIACLDQLSRGAFDMVITDLFMPMQDGSETIIAIRGGRNAIPIIGMTGGLSGAIRPYASAMKKLGADAVLAKPFSDDQLRQAIEGLLES